MSRSKTGATIPYSSVIGQEDMKLALELTYIQPYIGGVLLAGERGTAKSTIVRAFANAIYGKLPVTLPINATEDRVIGGWEVESLMKGEAKEQPGLLEEANGTVLYIDEVNLLDDHIVNIILDVTASGVLEIQRQNLRKRVYPKFTLIGTMNPEEGSLRPQLLDRFDLYVEVHTENERRREILESVLGLDEAQQYESTGRHSKLLDDYRQQDEIICKEILKAKTQLPPFTKTVIQRCVSIAEYLNVEGHRGERVLALAAQACAARTGSKTIQLDHIKAVARYALQHRYRGTTGISEGIWSADQDQIVEHILNE